MSAAVYSFDPNTHEYTGETFADESPEEPGVLLMPAFSTYTKPDDAPAGYKNFWIDDHWEQMEEGTQDAPMPREAEAVGYAERLARMQRRVGAMLDHVAQSMGYDSMVTAVSYADEPAVPKYQQEGQRLRRLRSMVWNEFYSMVEAIPPNDDAEWPTDADFEARLPKYEEMAQWEEPEPNPVKKPPHFPTQKEPLKPEPPEMN